MPAIAPRDKYFLRTLHQEISLFDRKLAHLQKYETFATETLRDAAVKKMMTKRDSLAVTARQLHADGVEFKPSELPPSLRPEDYVTPEPEPEVIPEEASAPVATQRAAAVGSGQKSYDFGKEIRDYLAQRKKA